MASELKFDPGGVRMRFELKFDLDNEAFSDPDEMRRVLERVANSVERAARGGDRSGGLGPHDGGSVSDSNGNRIGVWGVRQSRVPAASL